MTDRPVCAQTGDVVHVLRSGLTFGDAVRVRGDQIEITADLVEATRDKNGVTFLDDLSESAQVRRWGQPMLSVGPRPADLEPWIYGDPTWELAREAARRECWILPESLRQSALQEMARKFGPGPSSSTIHNAAPDPSIKQAEAQEAARRAAGLRQVIGYEPTRRVNP